MLKKSRSLPKRPKLIIIAGPDGSGKTTITSQILKHNWIDECIYINPDNIARDKFGDWNNPKSVIKAAKVATKMREQSLKRRQSLIFETVFSSQEKIDFIIRAKEAGYFIRLFFIGTNHPSINASRIVKRVLEQGHDVPITKIISRYSKAIMNCELVAPLVDRLYVYDNSVDFETATILFRSTNGQLVKKYKDINAWALSIYNKVFQSYI